MTDIAQIISSATGITGVQTQANLIPGSITSIVPPTTFVFWAGFDGTNNMASDPSYSGDAQSTAIGAMFTQVRLADSNNVLAEYYPGVGTPGTISGSSIRPTGQAIVTAQNAYDDFARAASTWLESNPGGTVTAMMATFSRGSMAGAIFSQMLYENGLVYVDPITNVSTMLAPPGEVGISAGLIISPVNTFGEGNLAFAPNVQNMTEVIALNEYRSAFAQELYPDMNTVLVAGNHGDAGSFYPDGLGSIYLEQYTAFFNTANPGMIDPVLPGRQWSGGSLDIHVEPYSATNLQNWAYGSVAALTEIIKPRSTQAATIANGMPGNDVVVQLNKSLGEAANDVVFEMRRVR